MKMSAGVEWAVHCCVALYLLGHNAFRLRDEGSMSVPRLVVTILCCVLIPVAVSVPSVVTLAVLALLMCGLATFGPYPSLACLRLPSATPPSGVNGTRR
jgi:hypothetical protein